MDSDAATDVAGVTVPAARARPARPLATPQPGSLTRSLRICQSREPDSPAREPPSLRHDQGMVTVAAQVRVGVGLGCDGDSCQFGQSRPQADGDNPGPAGIVATIPA